MKPGINFRQSAILPAMLACLLIPAASIHAQQKQAIMPDAEIEANVLKALASAPELADQSITTTTIYGTVTLTGAVRDEATRVQAETLASKAAGVKKVVDELTLGSAQAANQPTETAPADATNQNPAIGTNPNLQSDGTIAPPQPPSPDQPPSPPPPTSTDNQASETPQPSDRPELHRRPYNYGQNDRNPNGPPTSAYAQNEPYGAQQPGMSVIVPQGAMLRIRIDQGLDSKYAQPGSRFDGIVVNDVVADGYVAIPRGATVQGTVVDTKPGSALKGRGELYLQLNQVTLGGKAYPVVSDTWSSIGPSKTGQTVGNAVGLGVMGALIGGVAGGGPGALLGAGLGGAAGVGTSAASGRGQALIPPEAILTFHLAQQAALKTVSQAEMDRLGYGVPAGGQQRFARRPPPPPPYSPYYGPAYYYRGYPPYPY